MAVSLETIVEEMRMFEVEVEQDDVTEKLVELCRIYRLKEADIANKWVAYSITKHGLSLTLENLENFEHDSLSKEANKIRKTAKRDRSLGTKDLASLQELIQAEEEEENLLESYTTPSKGSQKRVLTTPENPQSKRVFALNRSPHLLFSPSSFSPSATPSQKYSSRTNRGEIVASFGTAQATSWHGSSGQTAVIELLNGAEESLTKNYKYMFQKLLDVRDVLSFKIEELGCALKDHYKIEEFSSVSLPAQEPVTVLGQIGCDSNGKLNAKSVVMEGDLEHSSGMHVPMDLSELKEYSLFPGQVVAVEGLNSTGRRLIASRIFEGVPLPFFNAIDSTKEEVLGDLKQQMILVACGPYTTSDSITYDPMMDLIEIIKKDQPDVCILLGPFLDAKHEQVENCQLTEPFEVIFNRCLKGIIEGTQSSGSHLIFVPSLRDVHHEFVYPQPPFSCYSLSKEEKQRVHFVSEPCMLNINGVTFGLTSTDILFHMGAEEISSSSGGSDRFSRILKHILTQRSYYPLYPPAEEVNIDYESFQSFAQMTVRPDVFIVPSELRYFIKDVIGCICMNPGRLTKGQVGGTYGRLYIRRMAVREEHQSPCIAAQVVKI
ncbi:DNA polymerase alpha subunit B [Protopterus annectens]|uniref:DNA polymerase alpha subunit B n=1 Tax=Protopterus annectens TaxID=7888 RepID=UPI001CF93DD0|nr:DNA polymerase alpha subunit B [Protopterus annectens]